MENASKALIIAGGVLVSLMVISLLVFFFNNIRDWQKVELSQDEVQQITEFNKQYDVYARDLYGSEILTIANKIVDYNKRESDNKGYSKIDLEVNFTKGLSNKYFTKKTYSASDLDKETKELNKFVEDTGNKKIYTSSGTVFRQIKKIYTMRTSELTELGFKREDYMTNLNDYTTYKNLLSQMKQTKFTYKEFEFDKNTGRVTKMKYELK